MAPGAKAKRYLLPLPRTAFQRRAYILADAMSVIELTRKPNGLRSAEVSGFRPGTYGIPIPIDPATPKKKPKGTAM